jgi:hypothetical protein
MSIDRVNINTTSFSLRAVNITGKQLRSVVDRLAGAAGSPGAAGLASLARQPGPAAMQSPADRFREIAPTLSSGSGAEASPASASGFAPGGSDRMPSLDARGLMDLLVGLVQRLLEAVMRLMSGAGSAEPGTGGGQTGGTGSSGGTGSCGSGGAGQITPTKPEDLGIRYANQQTGGSTGASDAARARERPEGGSVVKRMLCRVGKGALAAGANAVPGGGLALAGASALGGGRGPALSGGVGGGSLEDQIFQFLSMNLRQVEAELKGAMQESGAQGGDGDSRSAVAQKVQQLAQKRSEMVELLSNTLKTMHDTTQAVNRNIRS